MQNKKILECIIPILEVKDLSASLTHYTEVLGFDEEWQADAILSVTRDGFSIYLSQAVNNPSVSRVWVGVDDFDAIYAEYSSSGANIVMPPTNFPHAYEMHIADIDGNILRVAGEPR